MLQFLKGLYWEPQEYSRNITEYKDFGRDITTIFHLHFWGSLFGVPNEVRLVSRVRGVCGGVWVMGISKNHPYIIPSKTPHGHLLITMYS